MGSGSGAAAGSLFVRSGGVDFALLAGLTLVFFFLNALSTSPLVPVAAVGLSPVPGAAAAFPDEDELPTPSPGR